jgi:hypothetical protein
MIDLKLNSSHDLFFDGTDLVLVKEGFEVAQSAKIRLLFIAGEWFLNYLMGVDWFDNLFSTETSYEQKAHELRKTLINTVGVVKIEQFNFGIDFANRGAQVEFVVLTQYGLVSAKLGE